jgi:hypothetical protein
VVLVGLGGFEAGGTGEKLVDLGGLVLVVVAALDLRVGVLLVAVVLGEGKHMVGIPYT